MPTRWAYETYYESFLDKKLYVKLKFIGLKKTNCPVNNIMQVCLEILFQFFEPNLLKMKQHFFMPKN